MGGLFSKPKRVTPPPVPEPEPVPELMPEEAKEEVARRRRGRGGRRKTIITGALEPETVGKKTLLG